MELIAFRQRRIGRPGVTTTWQLLLRHCAATIRACTGRRGRTCWPHHSITLLANADEVIR
jgi:hypothetical protein